MMNEVNKESPSSRRSLKRLSFGFWIGLFFLFVILLSLPVINNITSEDIGAYPNIIERNVAVSIPNEMKKYQTSKVSVAMTGSLIDSILFAEVLESYTSLRRMNISTHMQVSLIDPSGGKSFQVVQLNSEEQRVYGSMNTLWQWYVTPLKQGDHELVLRFTMILDDISGRGLVDVDLVRKKVNIRSNTFASIRVFISNNWHFLLSGIFIPVIGYLGHKYRWIDVILRRYKSNLKDEEK